MFTEKLKSFLVLCMAASFVLPSTAYALREGELPRFDEVLYQLPQPVQADKFESDFKNAEETVQRVHKMRLTTLPGWPPRLLIEAVSENTTEGWGEYRLIPDSFAYPPANGIYGFELVGNPRAPGVMTHDSYGYVNFLWLDPPKNIKGIEIRGRRNEMVEMISE